MVRRSYPRVTNGALAARQDKLESDMQGLKDDVKELRAEVAPIHATLTQVQGIVKLAGALAGVLSFIGTAVSIWVALKH